MQNTLIIHCQYSKKINWQTSNKVTFKPSEQIHFWLIKIKDYTSDDLITLKKVLSPLEKTKMQRFRFEKDQKRYLITHSVLRQLLSKYLNVPPLDIQFGKGEHHKPNLAFPPSNLLFNISHSGDAIAIGVLYQNKLKATSIDFGIDIEQLKNSTDHKLIAKYYFSKKERFYLNQQTDNNLFYVYWTRKEALLKASGIGLLGDIQQLEVAEAKQNISIQNEKWAVFNNKNYQVLTFLIEKNLTGSIAIAGSETLDLKYFFLKK